MKSQDFDLDLNLILNVASVKGESVVDGPGLRVVVFSQGCIHNCKGCHNPQSHTFGTGKNISVGELYSIISAFKLCKGITFSGGEPFCQPEPFAVLAKLLCENGYEVACYTGFVFEELINSRSNNKWQKELLESIHILIDGPYIDERRSLELRFRGSDNQRIIDVPKSLASGKVVLVKDGRWAVSC